MGFIDKQQSADESSSSAYTRSLELRALLLDTLFLLFGLWLVYQAKRERPLKFEEVPTKLSTQDPTNNGNDIHQLSELLNLNQVSSADALIPYLTNFEDEDQRAFAADKIFKELKIQKNFKNVGVLGTIRVFKKELENKQGLEDFKNKLDKAEIDAKKSRDEQQNLGFAPTGWLRSIIIKEKEPEISIPLFQRLGPIRLSFIVRTPEEFRNALLLSSAIFLLGFWGLHLYWRVRRFQGDQLILPNIFALCSFGFLMMISLRDPLRDILSFSDFAWGVIVGNLLVALLTSLDYYNLYYALKARYARTDLLITTVPIALSLLLCSTLIIFGKGPGTSDAKVNLNIPFIGLPFQPSELVKILICFFIAAYFSNKWELIQNLHEKKFRFLSLPRVKDVWIVFLCVAAVLGLFILQKDLGPALLMAGLFLILFAIVRKQVLLSVVGFLTIIGGYVFNYYVYTFSQTAAARLNIWSAPWDTTVRGGEQIVHSFWALSTGGFTGTGLGLGDPRYAPAAHTDLILSALGEELGFIGLLLIFTLYATLFYRCIKIALYTTSPYTFFLVMGITIINALQILFISAAILGLIPLSGVISPFLSYGSTSMVMNFFAFGIVLVISGQTGEPSTDIRKSFKVPTKYLSWAFGLIALFILANAAWIQIWKADEIIVKSVKAPQADGISRLQDNPRITEVLELLPYGTIYDSKNIPLASSKWGEIMRNRKKYEALGIKLETVCREGSRCYPFGSKTFFLLGNVLTKVNWKGKYIDYIEKDYEARLRGIDRKTIENMDQHDYRELIPIIRSRYVTNDLNGIRHPYKPKDIHTSIDIDLQLRLTQIVEKELAAKTLKGGVVVLDSQSGDLLASVSYPYPRDSSINKMKEESAENQYSDFDRLTDRARRELYPPGSTFKVVTEMAALSKNDSADQKPFECTQIEKNRVGAWVRGEKVRDDKSITKPHGNITFKVALVHSCNAYFAQLGTDFVGAETLFNTARQFDITIGDPAKEDDKEYQKDFLNKTLPDSSFGQNAITANPYQMARVAATVANNGTLPYAHWINDGDLTDDDNQHPKPLTYIISRSQSEKIADAMLGVTHDPAGTAYKAFQDFPVQVAGKTGTAQPNEKDNLTAHSWFIGFAPYEKQKRIAFAVIVEHGDRTGLAIKIAKNLVLAARECGYLSE